MNIMRTYFDPLDSSYVNQKQLSTHDIIETSSLVTRNRAQWVSRILAKKIRSPRTPL